MRFLTDILAKAGLVVDGTTTLNGAAAATVDTDKFVVLDGSVVKYRTGSQLLSDIGGGTVSTLSVVSANGFAGTVANATTTPAITLSTTVTGLLKGNGTAISAAVLGTDYVASNIYTGDGTLTGNRTVTQSTFDLTFAATTSSKLFATGNWTVGGTTDAGYKLDVNGTVRFTGNFTLTNNANLITTTQFYGQTTNYLNSIFVGWDASAVYLGYSMGSLPIHLGSNGSGEVWFRTTGNTKIDSLAGTGTRMVVANASGVLSTQAIPSGSSGSTNRTTQTFTATSNQTVFNVTGTLVSGYFDVYLNGVRLNSSSYSSTSSSITLVDGANTGDIIDVINYDTLSITTLLPDQTGNAGKFLTTDGTNLSWASVSGSGTVTSVSVVSANGFAGTVANASTTPAITLTTTITGLVKGNGTALSAAVAGTDYQAPISLTTTGSSGASTFISNTLNVPNYTLSGLGGQPLSTNLTSLSGLTYVSTSFVKMTAAGTFALDTNTYLTGNQTITLSGDISGTGTTAITTTIGANKVTNSMLAQVATATFKGRATAATGNVEDLTGTQATALLDQFTSTLKGLVPASGGGTTNFLRADGTWAAPPSGGGYSVTSVSTTYSETATSGTKIVKANTSGGAFTITLPTAVGNTATIIIKKVAGTPALTIDGSASETIDGGTTATINKVYESITLISDNANWQIV